MAVSEIAIVYGLAISASAVVSLRACATVNVSDLAFRYRSDFSEVTRESAFNAPKLAEMFAAVSVTAIA